MLSFVGLQFGLRKKAFTAMIAEEFEVSCMPSHMGQQIAPIAKSLFALCAGKLSVIGDARCSTAAAISIGFDAAAAEGVGGGGLIDDVEGIGAAEETGGFNGSIKAVVTSIRGFHHGLSKVGQIIKR